VSVTLAFLLTLAGVLALVVFLSHLAREIRVETMMSSVHSAADRTIHRLLPGDEGRPQGNPAASDRHGDAPPEPPPDTLPLTVGASGFLTSVDEDKLLKAAVEADAVLLIDRHPGSSLITGTPMGAAWPRAGEPFAPETRARLVEAVAEAVITGVERTDVQDIAFGLRQLTDIAAKALSPGVNDPTTAVHALSHSSALLCKLAQRDLGPHRLLDDNQQVRVVLQRPDLENLLDLAVDQPLRYGAAEPAVLARIAMLLREVAWSSTPGRRPPVAAALTRLRATIDAQDFQPAELLRLSELSRSVEQALIGQWAHSPIR
jgi:uncharacterized membrane protein